MRTFSFSFLIWPTERGAVSCKHSSQNPNIGEKFRKELQATQTKPNLKEILDSFNKKCSKQQSANVLKLISQNSKVTDSLKNHVTNILMSRINSNAQNAKKSDAPKSGTGSVSKTRLQGSQPSQAQQVLLQHQQQMQQQY